MGRVALGCVALGLLAVVGESLGLNVRAYVAAVVALAAALLIGAGVVDGVPTQSEIAGVVGFTLTFVVVQLLPIPFPRGPQLELIRVEEAVVVPLVLLLDPFEALLAVAAGVVVGQLFGSKVDPLKATFNAAQMVVSVGAALLTTIAITGEPAPGFGALQVAAAITGLVAMFVVNQLLVAGVMRIAAGTSMRSVLLDDAPVKVGMWLANASLGALLVLPAAQAPAVLLFALVPLVILHATWRIHAEHARDEHRMRELSGALASLGSDVPVSAIARQLALSARDVIDADGAEVQLFDERHAWWVRRSDGTVESGDRPVRWTEPEETSGRISETVPLDGDHGAFGRLTVWLEPGETRRTALSRRDRALLSVLSHQASTTIDNSLLAARSAAQQRTISQVFEHSSEGMLVLDRHGRVRGWNPAMRSISGFPHATVESSPISLISPQLGSIVDATEGGLLDAVIATASGERRQIRASFAPIEAHDGAAASDDEAGTAGDRAPSPEDPVWVVVVRDVTLEHETERLKDDFVATVSHELRTPLTAIKGFLDTMQRDDIEFGAAQGRMFLQIMGEQADRLERLIGDLLDMSAIESGRPLEVDLTPVDLAGVVRRAVATFHAAHPESEVVFEAPDVGLIVEGDGQRLEQVVGNLLDNARKHGGVDFPIDVRITATEGERAVVSVHDQGPGIPEVDQRRIFDRFFVSADSVTRTGGGAGLGLYICRKLMQAMQGTIDVESRRGQGTKFFVRLPLRATALPGVEPHEAMRDDVATRRGMR